MVDHGATPEESMTTDAAPTAPAGPLHMPPHRTANIVQAIRWIADISEVAGHPYAVEALVTFRQIYIACPDQTVFGWWKSTIGAVGRPDTSDALGSTRFAVTNDDSRWTVTIHVHVSEDKS